MKLNKSCELKKGFSLIELLVVIVIIGILGNIAITQYWKATLKTKYTSMMKLVNTIAEAEERYYMIHDNYTDNFNNLDIEITGCNMTNKNVCVYDWGGCFLETTYNKVGCQNDNNAYVYYLQFSSYNGYGRACASFSENKNSFYDKLCNELGADKYLSEENLINPYKSVLARFWGFTR